MHFSTCWTYFNHLRSSKIKHRINQDTLEVDIFTCRKIQYAIYPMYFLDIQTLERNIRHICRKYTSIYIFKANKLKVLDWYLILMNDWCYNVIIYSFLLIEWLASKCLHNGGSTNWVQITEVIDKNIKNSHQKAFWKI